MCVAAVRAGAGLRDGSQSACSIKEGCIRLILEMLAVVGVAAALVAIPQQHRSARWWRHLWKHING